MSAAGDPRADQRARVTDGTLYQGNQQFKGNGRRRSCFLCGGFWPEETGVHVRILGRSRWVSRRCCRPAATEGD